MSVGAGTPYASLLIALLVTLAVTPALGDHPQDEPGGTVVFDHIKGNEWWVEVTVDYAGTDPEAVWARDTGDETWKTLTFRDWGTWAGSFHIEPGHQVIFRAMSAEHDVAESCWFSHPGGVEDCAPVTDERLAASTYVSPWDVETQRIFDVATDAQGNAYVAGHTSEGEAMFHDAFVAKYDADGAEVWSRQLAGSGVDIARSIALDDEGNIYIGGETASPGLASGGWQTTLGGQTDGFVAKLDENGAHLWSTFLGGEKNDRILGIGVDANHQVVAAGYTNSCDYPTYGPALQTAPTDCNFVLDGVITRLTRSGENAVFSTYYRGEGDDVIHDADVRPDGAIAFVGRTTSSDLPRTPDALMPTYRGHQDGFLGVLTGLGELEYGTYIGGGEADQAAGVEVDGSSVLLTGLTGSVEYPTTADALQPEHSGGEDCGRIVEGGPDPVIEPVPCSDIFVSVFDEHYDLQYSTFFGDQGPEGADGVTRDADGRIHLTGSLRSQALPGEAEPVGPAGGHSDAFLVTIAPHGGATERVVRIGGSDGDFGEEVAVNPDGSVWLAGWTWSQDYPTTAGAEQRQPDGNGDGVLTRFPGPSLLTFDSRNGNEWWVQVHVDGATPSRVQAMDTGDPWHELTLKDWGDWAASFHVEPGHDVRFRALVDGTWHGSCWFSHPEGVELCDDTPSGFDATFDTPGGNEWWVEVYVDGNQPIVGVDARADEGEWHTLTLRDWGAWARSFHVPDGSIVTFRAHADDGAIDQSGGYVWPSGAPAE